MTCFPSMRVLGNEGVATHLAYVLPLSRLLFIVFTRENSANPPSRRGGKSL